jgi:hypothetical protein
MNWWQFALLILVFSFAMLIVYHLLKTFVFSKIKVNSWVILALVIVVLLIPIFLQNRAQSGIFTYVQSGIFVILIMWFMDSRGFMSRASRKPKDNLVIRPKPKKNRIKNNQR